MCISVFTYREEEEEQGRGSASKNQKRIEKGGKQEEGKIQNSRRQLADQVT